MENKEVLITGWSGKASAGKTFSLYELCDVLIEKGENVVAVSFGNWTRTHVAALLEKGVNPSSWPSLSKEELQDIGENVTLAFSATEKGCLEYCLHGKSQNGRLRDLDIEKHVSQLGSNPHLDEYFEEHVERELINNGFNIALFDRRKKPKKAQAWGFIRCSRKEHAEIYQKEHGQSSGNLTREQISTINETLQARNSQDQTHGLLDPQGSILITRLNGVSNRKVAEAYAEILTEFHEGRFDHLPTQIIVGNNNTEYRYEARR